MMVFTQQPSQQHKPEWMCRHSTQPDWWHSHCGNKAPPAARNCISSSIKGQWQNNNHTNSTSATLSGTSSNNNTIAMLQRYSTITNVAGAIKCKNYVAAAIRQ